MKQMKRKVTNKIKTQLQTNFFLAVFRKTPSTFKERNKTRVFGTSHDIPGKNVTTLGKPPKRLNIKPKK